MDYFILFYFRLTNFIQQFYYDYIAKKATNGLGKGKLYITIPKFKAEFLINSIMIIIILYILKEYFVGENLKQIYHEGHYTFLLGQWNLYNGLVFRFSNHWLVVCFNHDEFR
jgi:hypothetical protein